MTPIDKKIKICEKMIEFMETAISETFWLTSTRHKAEGKLESERIKLSDLKELKSHYEPE